MKKLLIFAIVMLLASSCTCMLAQVPPQYIEVEANCEAVLPDYTIGWNTDTAKYVKVTDNCQIKSVTQDPVAGTILNAINPQVTVTITATDVFDNFTQVTFIVKTVDKIGPVILIQGGFLTENWDTINNMYDQADRLLAEQEAFFDANFDWDAAGIPIELRPTGQYDKKVLTIMTSPAHATTGYGGRFIMYQSNNDSFIAK